MNWEIVPLEETQYHGRKQENFLLNGRRAILVHPEQARPERAWVWRAEFFDAFPATDLMLLEQGYFIAYYSLSDLYGAPVAIEGMKLFYDYLTQARGLRRRADIFGFSRGGMYAVNFAAAYPEAVSTLYLDAPVMSMLSWPRRKGCEKEWEDCKALYGLTEETALTFKKNPIDRAEELIAHRIPVALVSGDCDHAVPIEENAALLAKKYRDAGAELLYIVKPGADHHPHGLEDPTPVAEFILKHAQDV